MKDSVKINMSSFCETLIEKFKKKKFPSKNKIIKTLKNVREDDLKTKKLFEKKLTYLREKKEKALESRRNTLNRKRRRSEMSLSPNPKPKRKRTKKE